MSSCEQCSKPLFHSIIGKMVVQLPPPAGPTSSNQSHDDLGTIRGPPGKPFICVPNDSCFFKTENGGKTLGMGQLIINPINTPYIVGICWVYHLLKSSFGVKQLGAPIPNGTTIFHLIPVNWLVHRDPSHGLL